jgi:hypothetical protein
MVWLSGSDLYMSYAYPMYVPDSDANFLPFL